MTSRAADVLFALPETYDSADPVNGPGARRRARNERKQALTAELGSAAANTKLADEADTEAAKTTASISPKIEQLATEHQLLDTTVQQLKASQPTTPTPLASPLLSQDVSSGPRATALGQARAAEYYMNTASSIRSLATWWVPLLLILMGVLAITWNWYHRERVLPLVIVFAVLILASKYPVNVMQIPRAAISPIVKMVPAP